MAGKKFSMQMETLVSVISRVITFKKCEWLQISTNTERKYIANLTKISPECMKQERSKLAGCCCSEEVNWGCEVQATEEP